MVERRRAAGVARHYRDEEGLLIPEIARRLGVPRPRSRRTGMARLMLNKGPSWERDAEPGGRELRSHPPAAASRGDVLPDGLSSALDWLSSTAGRLGGSHARPGHGTAPRGATRPPLPRPGGSVDRRDRSSAGTAHKQPSRRIPTIQPAIRHARSRRVTGGVCRGCAHRATERQGRRLRVLQLRREAPCCIPGAAGRNSKGCSWVQWLTRIRKVKGTIACQESGGHAQVSGVRRRGTRVIWRKLDCLKPNLQKMKRRIRRNGTCYRRHALRWHFCRVVATFGAWSVAQ